MSIAQVLSHVSRHIDQNNSNQRIQLYFRVPMAKRGRNLLINPKKSRMSFLMQGNEMFELNQNSSIKRSLSKKSEIDSLGSIAHLDMIEQQIKDLHMDEDS